MTEVKIRCDDCKFVEDCVDYGWQECKKFTPKPREPMTNEEWLWQCTTEQLAEAIYDLLIDRKWGSWSWELNGRVLRDVYEHGNKKSTKAIVEWLKEKHH